MLETVEKLAPRTVLEIGTARGGTLFLLTRSAASNAFLISLDLPGGKYGGQLARFPLIRRWMLSRIVLPGQTLRFVRADSCKEETLETVKRLLKGRPLEILFIDADYTYEGVKRDFETYSPLVPAGGLVIFHDIACAYTSYGVLKFWKAVRAGHRFEDYSRSARRLVGLRHSLLLRRLYNSHSALADARPAKIQKIEKRLAVAAGTKPFRRTLV